MKYASFSETFCIFFRKLNEHILGNIKYEQTIPQKGCGVEMNMSAKARAPINGEVSPKVARLVTHHLGEGDGGYAMKALILATRALVASTYWIISSSSMSKEQL